MLKSRFLWALWLLFALALYLFSGSFAALLLLLCSFLLPIFCVAAQKIACKGLSFSLSTPASCEKGQNITCALQLKNSSLLPTVKISGELTCQNLLTGQTASLPFLSAAAPRETEKLPFIFSASCCGRLALQAKLSYATDFFGLIKFRLKSPLTAFTLVFPALFTTNPRITPAAGAAADSSAYCTEKPGFDSSEPFALRDYREGDSPRAIHWKLTQKHDRLIVREASLPLENSILLVLDNSYEKIAPPPEVFSAAAEALCSLSQTIAARGNAHSIGWQHEKSGLMLRYPIANEEELFALLPRLLGVAPRKGALDTATLLGSAEQHSDAHIVCISANSAAPPSLPPTHGRVFSLLVCAAEAANPAPGENGGFLTFSPASMQATLADFSI